jgi:hypothetical protein
MTYTKYERSILQIQGNLLSYWPPSSIRNVSVIVRSTQNPVYLHKLFLYGILIQFSNLCLDIPFCPCSFALRTTVSDVFLFPTWSLTSTTHFINLNLLALTKWDRGTNCEPPQHISCLNLTCFVMFQTITCLEHLQLEPRHHHSTSCQLNMCSCMIWLDIPPRWCVTWNC